VPSGSWPFVAACPESRQGLPCRLRLSSPAKRAAPGGLGAPPMPAPTDRDGTRSCGSSGPLPLTPSAPRFWPARTASLRSSPLVLGHAPNRYRPPPSGQRRSHPFRPPPYRRSFDLLVDVPVGVHLHAHLPDDHLPQLSRHCHQPGPHPQLAAPSVPSSLHPLGLAGVPTLWL
jgi:hypothetical protein